MLLSSCCLEQVMNKQVKNTVVIACSPTGIWFWCKEKNVQSNGFFRLYPTLFQHADMFWTTGEMFDIISPVEDLSTKFFNR